MSKFGENIYKYRKEILQCSQEEFAEYISNRINSRYIRKTKGRGKTDFFYSGKAVSKWERGDSLPSIEVAALLAKEMKVPLDELFSDVIAEFESSIIPRKDKLEYTMEQCELILNVIKHIDERVVKRDNTVYFVAHLPVVMVMPTCRFNEYDLFIYSSEELSWDEAKDMGVYYQKPILSAKEIEAFEKMLEGMPHEKMGESIETKELRLAVMQDRAKEMEAAEETEFESWDEALFKEKEFVDFQDGTISTYRDIDSYLSLFNGYMEKFKKNKAASNTVQQRFSHPQALTEQTLTKLLKKYQQSIELEFCDNIKTVMKVEHSYFGNKLCLQISARYYFSSSMMEIAALQGEVARLIMEDNTKKRLQNLSTRSL